MQAAAKVIRLASSGCCVDRGHAIGCVVGTLKFDATGKLSTAGALARNRRQTNHAALGAPTSIIRLERPLHAASLTLLPVGRVCEMAENRM